MSPWPGGHLGAPPAQSRMQRFYQSGAASWPCRDTYDSSIAHQASSGGTGFAGRRMHPCVAPQALRLQRQTLAGLPGERVLAGRPAT
jgi:hypothetical protein